MTNITNTAEKSTLGYRVVVGVNPRDKEKKVLRPLIVNKETYDTARCLRFALENGYIQGGQFYANLGIVNGFLEAVQRLGKDGRDILLNSWLRIHPELKGTVDPETRQIGPDNILHVCVCALNDLRRKASDFNWICLDDNSVRANVQHIQSVGGTKDKEIFASAKISVGGTNLIYSSTTDKITASWQTVDSETGKTTEHAVDIVPESSGYSAMTLPFPTELASAPIGTIVTFTFFLRQGKADASVIPATAKVAVVSAG